MLQAFRIYFLLILASPGYHIGWGSVMGKLLIGTATHSLKSENLFRKCEIVTCMMNVMIFFQVPDYKSCNLASAEEKCRKKKHTVAKIITWHNITVISKLYEENVKVVHLVRDPRSRYLSAKELSLLTKKTDAQYAYERAVRRRQSRETISFKRKELRELQKMSIGDFLKKKYNASFDETIKAECKKDTNEFLQNLPQVCSITILKR